MTTATKKKSRKPSKPTQSPTGKKEQIANSVADRIIELLDQGNLPPWEQAWAKSNAGAPRNAVSNRPYRGINLWLTLLTQLAKGFDDPRWLTFNQANTLGGHVNKAETSTQIHLVKPWQPKQKQEQPSEPDNGREDEDQQPAKKRRIWIWRTHNVFNVQQTTGCNLPPIEAGAPANSHSPIEQAEAIIAAMPNPPAIRYYHAANYHPHYRPGTDTVAVPALDRFTRAEDHYNTVFHELVHSTGHSSRLARFDNDTAPQNLHDYGKEELIAGMGSAMLGQLAGTGHLVIERDASYIRHWRDAISANKSIVLDAALLAQKATDYIAGEPAKQ